MAADFTAVVRAFFLPQDGGDFHAFSSILIEIRLLKKLLALKVSWTRN